MKYKLLINFMGATFAAIGLLCIVQGVRARIAEKQSLVWPTTNGVILESRVELEERQRSTGSAKGRNTYTSCSLRVTYSYTVAGTEFKGNRIKFAEGGYGDSCTIADAIVNRYPPDTSVDVAYNPNKPSESVLEPGYGGTTIVLIIIGIPFLVGGMSLLKTKNRQAFTQHKAHLRGPDGFPKKG